MRGGLDDALDKLARRDELRRRAAGEATGTSPAVQELAEVIASVVNRNPKLAVTVGVEGAGDPVLLHFAVEDGVVQVNVDNSVASRVADSAPKHADFDIEVEEPDTNFGVRPAHSPDAGQETRRISYDDRDRYDPGTGYTTSTYGDQTPPTATPAHADDDFHADSAAFERRYEGHRRYDDDFTSPDFAPARNGGPSARESAFPTADGPSPTPHPLAATPPPQVPPQTSRRMHTDQHRAPEEAAATPRAAGRASNPSARSSPPNHSGRPTSPGQSAPPGQFDQPGQFTQPGQFAQPGQPDQVAQPGPFAQPGHFARSSRLAEPGYVAQSDQFAQRDQFAPPAQPAQPAQRGLPTPLPKPIPLRVDSEETELAAKRLAALLRDNPSLLEQAPPD